MKLDYDCVRNIMLTIESLENEEALTEENFKEFPLLKTYSIEKICYSVLRIREAGYIPPESTIEVIGGIIFAIRELT